MIPSNFTQYDAQRRQLREASPEEIDSALELLLKNDAKLKESIAKEEKYFSGLKQEAKSAKVVVYNDIPLSREAFFEFIERAAPIVCQQKRDERKQELLPQALVSLARKKAQENLQELLTCAVSVSKEYQDELPLIEKRLLYSRLITEVHDILRSAETIRFNYKTPTIATVLGSGRFPSTANEQDNLQSMLGTLKGNGYVNNHWVRTLTKLLFSEKKKPVPSASPISPRIQEVVPILSIFTVPDSQQDKIEYLTVVFGLPPERAQAYASKVTLEGLESFYRKLSSVMEEEYAQALVKINPELLLYPPRNLVTQYRSSLRVIREAIRRDPERQDELEEKYGIRSNLHRYAKLESLVALKEELLKDISSGEETNQGHFNLDVYKSQLLQKAGLDQEIVRGLTEGKNGRLIGKMYAPKRHFEANVHGKVSPQSLLQLDHTFEEMIRAKAMVKQPTGPVYSLNPSIEDITDPYLREYMRITLHGDAIVAREGRINPQFDFGEI